MAARPALIHRTVESGEEVALDFGAIERSGFDGDECSSAFACEFSDSPSRKPERAEILRYAPGVSSPDPPPPSLLSCIASEMVYTLVIRSSGRVLVF